MPDVFTVFLNEDDDDDDAHRPKRLVSEAWKLFNVLWSETIRIKPEKYYRVSFFFTGTSYLTFYS